jgi:hypothetical protein
MDWTTKLELAYRVFARQHTDTSLMFQQMRESLTDAFGDSVIFSEVTENFWKCSAEDIDKARERGLLLMELNSEEPSLYLVVRDMPIVVSSSDESGIQLAENVLEKFGSVFASVRVVSATNTEIQAV